MLKISTELASVEIREDLGAAVARYDLQDGRAVFRPSASDASDEFDMACNVMLPWCNRISDGGFYCDDVFYPLSPNRQGDQLPLHGNAFQQVWRVTSQTDSSVTLCLESDTVAPFHYYAEICYCLEQSDLYVELSVTNLSDMRLPYGFGLHPWFIQEPDCILQSMAESVILTNDKQLPAELVLVDTIPDWNFRHANSVPLRGIDNCFVGWDRSALIHWPSRNLQLSITVDDALPYYHVYSPGKQSDFFCFEPMSHGLNAHNWPDRSLSELVVLAKGESMRSSCRFSPSSLD